MGQPRDDAMTDLTLEQADAVLPGLSRFVKEGGPPPHGSFVPSSAARDDRRSNAGWGALVLVALGALLIPVSIASATFGPWGYASIAVWFVGVVMAVRKWLVLRGQREEPVRDGLFLLPRSLLVVTGVRVRHIPAPAIHERGVQQRTPSGTASLRVRADTPRRGTPWTTLGSFDLDAPDLDARLREWVAEVA